MNPETSATSASETTTEAGTAPVAPAVPRIDPIVLFSTLRHPLRLKLLRIMAGGKFLSATEASQLVNRDIDIVIQQFRILRKAGLVQAQVGADDARYLFYYIPPEFCPEPDVLKFDFCVVQFSAIPDYSTRKRRR